MAFDRWFQAFFGLASDGFVALDPSGRIVMANPPAELLLGYGSGELQGQPVAHILPGLRADPLAVARTSSPLPIEGRRRDGEMLTLEVTLSSVEAGAERVTLARLIGRPGSDGPREPALPRAFEEEFLPMLSHELRSPLQAILGWAQLLRSPRSPDLAARALAGVERGIHWQSQVIDDLLEMAEIIGGEIRLDRRPASAAALIESAVERVMPAAVTKGVRVTRELAAVPEEVFADPERMARAIARLLGNAVRFTSEGGEVGIRLERVAGAVRVTVSDTGDGLDPDSPYADDWFRRSKAVRISHFGRFGVGLSNVQRIVEMHSGQVGAETAGPGLGTTFFLTIPLSPAK